MAESPCIAEWFVNEGIIYVLTNPAMPDMVKIGKTGSDLQVRLDSLYSTGVPLPFECAYAAKVDDVDKWEKAFHTAFGPCRVNPNREFFSINPDQAVALLELMAVEDVTPVVRKEADGVDVGAKAFAEKLKRNRRRPNADFSEMGIPVGSRLEYTGEGDHFCTVRGGRRVEFDGKMWMISPLTQKLLGLERPVRGIDYWQFDGRDLKDIYEETYESD